MDNSRELATLCRNIRYLRISHGLSKKKMAEIMGIGVRSLNRMERGDFPSGIGISVFFRIHRTFGVLPSRLVSEELERNKVPHIF